MNKNDPVVGQILDRVEAYKINAQKDKKFYIVQLPEYSHDDLEESKYIKFIENSIKAQGYMTDIFIKENTYTEEQLKSYKSQNMAPPPTTFERRLTIRWN